MITFADAKSHLRVDHNAEDADIALKLKLAAAIVEDYIGVAAPITAYSADIADAATLLVLGEDGRRRDLRKLRAVYRCRGLGTSQDFEPAAKLVQNPARHAKDVERLDRVGSELRVGAD